MMFLRKMRKESEEKISCLFHGAPAASVASFWRIYNFSLGCSRLGSSHWLVGVSN